MVFSCPMAHDLLQKVESAYVKRNPDVRTGDTVRVHLRIVEGGKERIQVFEGVVIAVSGVGLGKSITVRKISYGVGVEKILPLNAPVIKKIDIIQRGEVRRSRLYYMRRAVGKRSLDAGTKEGFEAIREGDEEVVSEEVAVEAPTESAESTESSKEEAFANDASEAKEETNEESAGTASSENASADAAAPAQEDAKDGESK